MSAKQKVKMPKVAVVAKPKPEPVKDTEFARMDMLFGATDTVLKGIAVLAASNVLSQPQFAYQASQAGLIELSDVLFKYMTGQVNSVPATPAAPANTPTFG